MTAPTSGPWQSGRMPDSIVSAAPIEDTPTSEAQLAHYGGHLIAESVAPCNRPLIAAAPTLLRRLERANESARVIAHSLEHCAYMVDARGLTETARSIRIAAEHLNASARLNERVILRARGHEIHSESEL